MSYVARLFCADSSFRKNAARDKLLEEGVGQPTVITYLHCHSNPQWRREGNNYPLERTASIPLCQSHLVLRLSPTAQVLERPLRTIESLLTQQEEEEEEEVLRFLFLPSSLELPLSSLHGVVVDPLHLSANIQRKYPFRTTLRLRSKKP